MEHSIRHNLDKDKARKALHKAFDSYRERFAKYSPTADWQSEDRAKIGFSAKGITLDGVVELTDEEVIMELKVPFLLKPFRGKAVTIIDEEINKWIGKAKRGELDDA